MDGNGTNDCHGHGTNVAGIVGATTYGVAKQVTLQAERELDCTGNGTVSGAISGVDWVTKNSIFPAVANMSFTAGTSLTLDTAVNSSIAAGVTYVVAAGNANSDACNFSLARALAAITVGAIDLSNDTRASFSNIGTCVDLFALGVSILSAGIANDTATSVFSGTSQASLHVAGCAARHLQTYQTDSSAQVWARLFAVADVSTTASWLGVINLGTGSLNVLLHCGSLNDLLDDGDSHLTTVEGIPYDFQGAGEFTVLRDGNGLEI